MRIRLLADGHRKPLFPVAGGGEASFKGPDPEIPQTQGRIIQHSPLPGPVLAIHLAALWIHGKPYMVAVEVLGPLLEGSKGAADGPGSQLEPEPIGKLLPPGQTGQKSQDQPQTKPQHQEQFRQHKAALPTDPGIHASAPFFSPRVSLDTFSPLLKVAVNTYSPSVSLMEILL